MTQDFRYYFTNYVLRELMATNIEAIQYRNYKRVKSMDLMKIRGASIDRAGYFHCLPDLPSAHIYLEKSSFKHDLYRIIDRADVLLEIYTIKPAFCTVFTYSFYNKEVVIAQGFCSINKPLKIFKEGLPMLQFGKPIFVKSEEQPVAKFALLDSESRLSLFAYQNDKYHGCKLHHSSGHDAQIMCIHDYGFSTNELMFIT